MQPVVTLPTLKDHAEYAAVAANIEKLEAELAIARREAASVGVVNAGADSHASDDVDKAVDRFFKDEQKAREASVRAGIRASALERAIKRETAKIPELYRQAVDMVGRAAAEQHTAVVAEMFEHRRKLSEMWELQHAICTQLRATVNDPSAPGYLSYDHLERYAWPPPMVQVWGNARLASEAAFTAVQGFKQAVHEPLKKEASGVISRLKDALWGSR